MSKRRTNPPFLNGVPELLILHQLSHREMHGYELVQAIRSATDQAFDFGEGCIYPILHRLEADQMLSARRVSVAGRNRVVYQVTDKGHKQLAESVTCWEQVVKAVYRVLQGGTDDARPALARSIA
jgi:PadR family transcriptional regulator, regulatory protein PadR